MPELGGMSVNYSTIILNMHKDKDLIVSKLL